MQENHYDPWGLGLPLNADGEKVGGSPEDRFKFIRRESQKETNWIDLQARFYDPQIGRFLAVNPVTETQEDLSTYQYGWNNPVLRSDPNGQCPGCDDPFLIGKLIATAWFDTKHALLNTSFRSSGLLIRADYASGNGHQKFEAKLSLVKPSTTLVGQGIDVVKAVLDLGMVAAGAHPANLSSILSTGTETQAANVGTELVETVDQYVSVINSQEIKGLTRSEHRNSANRGLLNQMESNAEFKQNIDSYFGTDLSKSMKSPTGTGLRNPPNTQWHHPVEQENRGILWLLDKMFTKTLNYGTFYTQMEKEDSQEVIFKIWTADS